MKKDPEVFLRHILSAALDIENHIRKIALNAFLDDLKTQDAVIRKLEIIGEAVRNLPSSFRERHANIPWREIAGMRDKLAHDYFGVDLFTVWNMAGHDVPLLKRQIHKILNKI
jgi:uncharacterized protein with HEPN domain